MSGRVKFGTTTDNSPVSEAQRGREVKVGRIRADADPVRAWIDRNRIEIGLVAFFLVLVAPWVNEMTAQPAARYLLTAAIVEEHTVELDAYEHLLGVDRVERDGHVYSDKAPLQPLLGVPVLAVAERVGIASADEAGHDENIGLWTQTLAFCALPGAALLLLMRRHAMRHASAATATTAALGLSFGSMLLVFSTNLYGHVLTAACAFAAWHVATSTRGTVTTRAFLAGGLMALAVGVEFPTVLVAAVVGVWVLVVHRLRAAACYAAPLAVMGAAIIAWNRVVYGTAESGYSSKGNDRSTFEFLQVPKPSHVVQILVGDKGLIFTPIVLVALASVVVGLWQRRWDLAVPAAAFASVFWLQAGWSNPWGGEPAAPRYLLVAVPFLIVPLADAVTRLSPLTTRLFIGLGALSMGLAATTLELVPDGERLIGTHLRYLREDGLSPTIFSLAGGPIGWIVHAALGIAAWRYLRGGLRAERNDDESEREVRVPHEVAAPVAAANGAGLRSDLC